MHFKSTLQKAKGGKIRRIQEVAWQGKGRMDMPCTHRGTRTPPEPDIQLGRWENLPLYLVAIKSFKDGIFSARRKIYKS